PSCTYLRAEPGETIALAFDALMPGGRMRNDDYEWIQPPTRYHAVGVIKGPGGDQGTDRHRERVTVAQLQRLASLPPTDTADRLSRDFDSTGLLLVASLIGLWVAWRGFGEHAREGAGQRVAPDGVRR